MVFLLRNSAPINQAIRFIFHMINLFYLDPRQLGRRKSRRSPAPTTSSFLISEYVWEICYLQRKLKENISFCRPANRICCCPVIRVFISPDTGRAIFSQETGARYYIRFCCCRARKSIIRPSSWSVWKTTRGTLST